MEEVYILGIKIHKIALSDATDMAIAFLGKDGKKVITTPNVEFIMKAQKDLEFKRLLNNADLAIPDSARFTWTEAELSKRSFVSRLLLWPFFFTSQVPGAQPFPVTTGVDLMENLVAKSGDCGFSIGLFGGKKGVADKARECLLKKYPKAKIIFAEAGGRISEEGEGDQVNLPKVDFLFVALGQGKQEKWIDRSKDRVDAKVFMGVGGAFDYLSGEVRRAPLAMRRLGLEWLYRIITQPWRIGRFGALVKYTFLILGH